MSDIDPEKLAALDGLPGEADVTLDLRGATLSQASKALDETIAESRQTGASGIVVHIDPATPTSGETLFQPLARQLLKARAAGDLHRFKPFVAQGLCGFHLQFKSPTG